MSGKGVRFIFQRFVEASDFRYTGSSTALLRCANIHQKYVATVAA